MLLRLGENILLISDETEILVSREHLVEYRRVFLSSRDGIEEVGERDLVDSRVTQRPQTQRHHRRRPTRQRQPQPQLAARLGCRYAAKWNIS